MQLAAARAHFLQVRLQLLEERVLGGDRDHGHVLVHQRERPVLQFSRGVGFGVDVGDFLELERPFHRDRIVDSAAEKQRVVAPRELLRPFLHLRLELEHALEGRGKMPQGE